MTSGASQMLLSLSSHNNQSLFSDHYLDDILRRSDTWRSAIPRAQAFLAWLRELYAQEKAQLPHYKESQLEDNWFKPIFDRLGHTWEGQAAVPGLKRSIKKPDFVFFPDEAVRKTAVSRQNSTDYANHALAVGEVKAWEINLSKKTGTQPIFDDQNPMFQIDTYLTLTGLEWGVLSNGRLWRLLHKNSSRTLETYFEIDLLAALEQPDEEKATAVITYFWLFFNQASCRADKNGRLFLNDALEQSRAYALALEADLRDNAYRSLEQLIIGFFAGDPTLDVHNSAHRTLVYQNSLYLLYRLLFLFYGESRALLPMHNPFYKEQYALQQLAKRLDSRRNQLANLPTTGRRYWNQLQELFRLISGLDPQLNAELGVPRYNGGLFDPEQHPFLQQRFVGDRALALAIDYLATRRIIEKGKPPAYQTVDYRTLDVRQLGSIYEGLLEYKVVVAAEEMVTVSKKGVETWVPLAEKGRAKTYGDRRRPGDLYLTTDKGERKATGSYYTPDYIVEYIVENTLGPLVEQARERTSTSSVPAEPVEAQRRSDLFIAEILKLNVLDPAMGSGHFLVEATNYLARVLATDEYTQAALEVVPGTGDKLRDGKGGSPVPGTANTTETDLLYWKRRVVEACIYGVDKNPMAVELAKLSLWLKTAAADKPLSFLDHHLQHGDSLIGAWLDDLQRAPGRTTQSPIPNPQAPLFNASAFTRDAGLAVKGVATIESLPTLDIETVHAKEATWRDIQNTHVARWRRLADLWVSAYFGNAMAPEEYRALADRLQHFPGKSTSLLTGAQAAQFLQHPAVIDNDYFHWELAFPEVFFDERGNPLGHAAGFDAVIGNPPYVRQEQMSAIKPFLPDAYQPVYKGTADLYVYFLYGGVNWLRSGGFLSYIVSNKWLRADYGEDIRRYLTESTLITQIVDFGHAPIFAEADTFPCILIFQKPGEEVQSSTTQICVFPRDALRQHDMASYITQKSYLIERRRFGATPWSLEGDQVHHLMNKIANAGPTLAEYSRIMPLSGIKTGLNSVYLIDQSHRDTLIDEDPSSDEVLKPYLRGRDLKRWAPDYQGLWIILLKSSANHTWPWTNAESEEKAEHIFSKTFPAIYAYMKKEEKRLRKRSDSGVFWWELRSCAYYHVFEEPNIMWQDLAYHPRFSFVNSGVIPEMTCFSLPYADLWILACLNSPLLWAWLWRNTIHGKDEVLRLKTTYTQRIPIAIPTEEQRSETIKYVESLNFLAQEKRQTIEELLGWLRVEFGIEKPGQQLEQFAALNTDSFIKEVKKRRPRSAGHLSPADVRILQSTHAQYGGAARKLENEINQLEQKVSNLVNQAYGLTDEEIAWLWETAPPRMPIIPPPPGKTS